MQKLWIEDCKLRLPRHTGLAVIADTTQAFHYKHTNFDNKADITKTTGLVQTLDCTLDCSSTIYKDVTTQLSIGFQ